MPGVVKSILCETGALVEEGANIVTLEAMKMQNPLFAPMSGRVRLEILIIHYFNQMLRLLGVLPHH